MRKVFLLIVLTFLSITSFGQEFYRSFLEEGKVWTYHFYNDMSGRDFYESITVRGDTIIDKRNYKKIIDVETGRFDCAMREEGKKVFVVFPHYSGESLLYDFGLNEGSSFPLDSDGASSDFSTGATVVSVDTIVVGSHAFRALDVRPKGDSWPYWWVEGIGGMHYLTSNIQKSGDYYNFYSCQLDGKTLFTNLDFQTLGVIPSSIKEFFGSSSENSIYDLQGRRLSCKPTKGVYIQNGKKFVVK